MDPNIKFLFSETNFNRSAKMRQKTSQLAHLIRNPQTKHILIWRGKILFNFSSNTPRIGLISHNHKFWYNLNAVPIENGKFVGFQEDTALFYHDIPDWNDLETKNLKEEPFLDESRHSHPAISNSFAFCEIRSLMTVITKSDAAILTTVKGIYEWNNVTNFCNKCGSATINTLSGWEKVCSACNIKHFPRTDPVVIMMVFNEDKALLGRSSIWPKGMFSCLAGFMEPGESVEAAVKRETFEETGILVENVKYVTSQPWPFPSSLMIGCIAKAKSNEILIDKDELEDARWFTREEIRQAIETKTTWWPARKGSIARFLISQWVKKNI